MFSLQLWQPCTTGQRQPSQREATSVMTAGQGNAKGWQQHQTLLFENHRAESFNNPGVTLAKTHPETLLSSWSRLFKCDWSPHLPLFSGVFLRGN